MKEENKLRAKEIINVKKQYLDQIEKFDSKIYFTFLSVSISLVLLNFKYDIIFNISNLLLYSGIGLFLITTLFLESILDNRRKKVFNELINEIKLGKFKELK